MSIDPVQQALADLDSGDLAQRLDALQRLRALKDERIAPRLIPLLRDSNPGVRLLSAEVLGRNRSTGAVRALTDSLYDDHADVRAAAADALGEIGDRAATPALIDALYDEVVEVRFAAAQAIGLIGDPRAIVDLIFMLDNADAPLAMMAAQALHQIGTPEALAAIQHLQEGEGYNFEVPDLPPQADETLRHIPLDRWDDLLREETPEPNTALPPVVSDWLTGEESAAPEEQEAPVSPVRFSAYTPREVMPNVWHALRAYVFKPTAANAVAADAAQALGATQPSYREVERDAQTSIAEGALITATPELTGFQFNPPSAQVAFYEDWQRFEFKLRAVSAPFDQASNGRLTFTVEGVIVADIPLSVYVGENAPAGWTPPGEETTHTTRPLYQSVFCSYSHKDTQIVERVERAYKALGLTFLRDVVTLKSGQDWNEELLRLIDRADIFQLFWSSAAASSPAVRKEWLRALGRQREGFIRPVFWEQPLPSIPPELSAIHFAYEPDLDQA